MKVFYYIMEVKKKYFYSLKMVNGIMFRKESDELRLEYFIYEKYFKIFKEVFKGRDSLLWLV